LGDRLFGVSGSSNLVIAPFSSTGTSGLRMTNQGNIGIGTAFPTAGYILEIGGSCLVDGGLIASQEITSYYSDARLKGNITTITNAVDKVMAINGVYYNANQLAADLNGEDITQQKVGLLAQEVEAILPQVIRPAPFDIGPDGNSKSGENYKTLQYERIVPLLVEAIKELKLEIDILKKKLN